MDTNNNINNENIENENIENEIEKLEKVLGGDIKEINNLFAHDFPKFKELELITTKLGWKIDNIEGPSNGTILFYTAINEEHLIYTSWRVVVKGLISILLKSILEGMNISADVKKTILIDVEIEVLKHWRLYDYEIETSDIKEAKMTINGEKIDDVIMRVFNKLIESKKYC